MKSQQSISKIELPQIPNHHAYCFLGHDSVNKELVSIIEEQYKIVSGANPDFFEKKYEIFTIDNARELKELSYTKPVDKTGKKIFILTVNNITIEAQNALLKLLEEPPACVYFFIIIPSAHLLLPTVKSRLYFINLKKDGLGDPQNAFWQEQARSFLKLSKSAQLAYVKKLTDEIADEKKTKQNAISFLNALERIVYENNGVKNDRHFLEAISLVKKYIYDRAPSMKMLLEYVVLNS